MKIRSVIFLLVCAILSIASSAAAQVGVTGTINGTVTDTSDAVVPGASVQLKDEGTGLTKDAVTNQSGAFEFRALNFGTYQVTVTPSTGRIPASCRRMDTRSKRSRT